LGELCIALPLELCVDFFPLFWHWNWRAWNEWGNRKSFLLESLSKRQFLWVREKGGTCNAELSRAKRLKQTNVRAQ
jgi:hypothetical protein